MLAVILLLLKGMAELPAKRRLAQWAGANHNAAHFGDKLGEVADFVCKAPEDQCVVYMDYGEVARVAALLQAVKGVQQAFGG